MKVIHMYSGDDGESHFEDLEIPEDELRYGAMLSATIPATGIVFRTVPPGVSIDFHTAPSRQFVIHIVGVGEFETSDGSTRRLAAGDVLLADDTTGQGHRSRTIEGPRKTIFVPVPKELDLSTWRTPK